MTRTLALVFAATFGTTVSFYLLLSSVPLYADSVGAGEVGAGLATGALMFSTVAAELLTPRLMDRFGHRLVFGAGLVLLGVPALALPASDTLAAILAVCVVRGLGFAILVVVSSVMVAYIVPGERRGEGLGLYGAVVGVSSIVALPLGPWLAAQVGFAPVFVAGGLAALAGLAAVPGLPGGHGAHGHEHAGEDGLHAPTGVLAGLRTPALARPSLLFGATTMAAGVVVTFLPLAVTQGGGNVAALALLVQAVTSTVTRWWAGRHGDRHGAAGLLVPGVLLSGLGMLGLVLTGSPVAVVAGMALFGAGFGVAQNATLALMFNRVQPSGYGTVSALWNLAYDAGLGLGATGFGLLAARTGYPAGFALTAALVLSALWLAWRERAAEGVTG